MAAGDSIAYSFDNLPQFGPCYWPYCHGVELSVNFSGDLFEPGDSVKFELYEDSLAGTPFARQVFNGSGAPRTALDLEVSGWLDHPDPWRDLQGAVRFTVLNGSVDLQSISYLSELNGTVYAQTIVVPEPRAWHLVLLFALAASVVVVMRKTVNSSDEKSEDPAKVSGFWVFGYSR